VHLRSTKLDNEQVVMHVCARMHAIMAWRQCAAFSDSLQDPGSCPSGGAGAQVEPCVLSAVPRIVRDVVTRRHVVLKGMVACSHCIWASARGNAHVRMCRDEWQVGSEKRPKRSPMAAVMNLCTEHVQKPARVILQES
jgi:hypothetical protein